jgi:hypothetical protein
VILGPVFALFRWRFKRAIRFIPALIFLAFALYISLGACFYRDILLQGVEQSENQIDSLISAYIVSSFILSQSDFWIVFFFIFPVYEAAQVVINIQG